MNKGLVILGLIMIVSFVVFKYIIVPAIVSSIQEEAGKYIGPFESLVTLENLKTLCGLTEASVPIPIPGIGISIPIPVKPIIQIVKPEILERCNQLATLMQILALEIYIYSIGFILLVVGLVIGGKREVQIIREVEKPARKVVETETEEVEEEEEVEEKPKKGKKFCSECGSPVRPKDKFCKKCGKKV